MKVPIVIDEITLTVDEAELPSMEGRFETKGYAADLTALIKRKLAESEFHFREVEEVIGAGTMNGHRSMRVKFAVLDKDK
ncbi:hypothetical protein [Methylobacter sp.]|uniref:hypothetical protein n=1 Tax=Methylobacter sp. TaxID=2051955 RepID=UPI001217F74F|nr:hypothetical protein [Methylobacter sp.]TAK59526.1 MAG: hypothetical protein EPO18_20405 [Methylobacter sp.]